MRSIQSLPVITLVLLLAATASAQEMAEGVYKKALPSVMTLLVEKQDGKASLGTGFMAVKDGAAVTAWHVVKNANRVTAKFSNGEEFEVSGLIDKDEKRDVAMIRVKVFGRTMIPLVAADPEVEAKAFVVGAPRGFEFSLSDGLISQVQTIEGVKQFQFTCAVSPGNSGGPLMNSKGEAIGVVSWGRTDGQNLNFAVPVSYVLGLDSSLPTQPWQSVKVVENSPVRAGAISNDAFDKLSAECVMTRGDCQSALEFTYNEIFRKKDGFRGGVPFFIYRLQRDLGALVPQVESAVSADPARERIRAYFQGTLRAMTQQIDYFVQGTKAAQKEGGFGSEANDLFAKAGALRDAEDAPPLKPEDVKVLTSSKAYLDTLPYMVKLVMGLIPDEAGFVLGALSWPRNSLTMMKVEKDGLAYRLGIRQNDAIIDSNGKSFEHLQDFKLFIKNSLGKRIKVNVW